MTIVGDMSSSAISRPSLLSRIAAELGVYSILSSPRDTKLLCLSRFTRLFAYGASTLILALYLSSLDISDTRIGLFMTMTLVGDVAISFLLTLVADGLGRRRILVLGAALMCASGVVFTFSGNYWILVAASVLGVISPSGNEIGPFRAIEESTLAQLTPTSIRSDIFAWYTLIGTAGTASGTIVCGWLVQALISKEQDSQTKAYRIIFGIYAGLGVVKLILSLLLSEACEAEPPKAKYHEVVEMDEQDDDNGRREAAGLLSDSEDEERSEEESSKGKEEAPLEMGQQTSRSARTASSSAPKTPGIHNPSPKKSVLRSLLPSISTASRKTLFKLCLLFAVDSLASGLVPMSWITYFFKQRYGIGQGSLGTLFFVTNAIAAVSNLFASSMAKRIGLVKTMVFTHLPAAVLLALIPVPGPDHTWLAMLFLIGRSCIQNMDQAPRQAFISLAVLPTERTAVMGVVNVVKTLSQSGGPVVTGWLAGMGKFWIAFLVAGCLKAGYDVGMLKMFLGYRSREEQQQQVDGEEEEERVKREQQRRRQQQVSETEMVEHRQSQV